jgi:hypothetical protein
MEINNPVSIQSEEIQNIVLYPNPSNSGNLNVACEYPIECLTIMDQFGRILKCQNSPSSSVDISALNPGIYFVRITTQIGEQVLRFQKL